MSKSGNNNIPKKINLNETYLIPNDKKSQREYRRLKDQAQSPASFISNQQNKRHELFFGARHNSNSQEQFSQRSSGQMEEEGYTNGIYMQPIDVINSENNIFQRDAQKKSMGESQDQYQKNDQRIRTESKGIEANIHTDPQTLHKDLSLKLDQAFTGNFTEFIGFIKTEIQQLEG